MSLQGKLLRGLQWHNFRNLEGEYHTDITEDPHKMEELNFYLNFLKGKDNKKVHKLLEELHLLDLKNKPAQMKELSKKLTDTEFLKSNGKTDSKEVGETDKKQPPKK